MKEYGFNTTLLHGTEGNNPHGATQDKELQRY